MPEKIRTLTRAVCGLALIISVVGLHAAFAQKTAAGALTGDWTASFDPAKPDQIHLSFERRAGDGRGGRTGLDYNFADLQGLSREQAAAGGPVKYSLAREAGRIDFEGEFRGGKGAGTFRFAGNQDFVAAMKSRGFDFEGASKANGERLFAAATLNVTTAQVDDLLSAGLGKLDADDLFKAAIFKIDSKFVREMRASGFPDLGLEELVKARIFKVDPDFVKQVARMGLAKEGFEGLVKMRIFKITPEFIAEVNDEGLTNLSLEDLVKARIFKIDGEFIRQAKAEGVPLEVEKLVEKRIGVRGR